LMQILQLGTLDPMQVTQAYLEAFEIPNAEKYLKQPSPPPPDPKIEAMKMKAQLDTQKATQDMQIKEREAQLRAAGMQNDLQMKAQTAELASRNEQIQGFLKAVAAQQATKQKAAEGGVKLATMVAQHQEKMKQQKEIQKSKPIPKGK